MTFKYRKKPVVIEAYHNVFDDTSTRPIPSWMVDASTDGTFFWEDGDMFINTLEGPLRVSDGDWIIRGIHGELYPCKPDIFEATYDKVEE